VSRVPVLACLTIAAATFAACRREPTGLEGHGTVEVTQVDVAPTAAARVVTLRVDEGDAVRPGDTVAILTQATLASSLAAEAARLARAEATLRDLRAGSRPAEIDRAQSELAAAEAEAARAAKDLDRIRALAERSVVSRQQLDQAAAAAQSAAARRDAAAESLRLLQQGTRPEQIRAAEAEVSNARAAVASVRATAGDLVLVAPVAGAVLGRWAEPGEVVGAGAPVLTLGETGRPYVRVYLPARALGSFRVGSPAVATLDGVPGSRFDGHVVAVNPQAEYTTRLALTREERADLLFGVKVALDDTTGTAKPGVPATVRIGAPRR
jgi:HlyD family secretion protein